MTVVKKSMGAHALWFIISLIVLSGSTALAAFPCEDVNNDGVCQEGVDNDISAQIAAGFFSTPQGIVIPAGIKGISLSDGLSLFADQNISVQGKIKAESLQIGAGGSLTVGDDTDLKGQSSLDLSAQQNVSIGAGSTLSASKGLITIMAWDGSVSVGEEVKFAAGDGVEITSLSGDVIVLSEARFQSKGDLMIDAGGNVTLAGARLQVHAVSITAGGELLDLSNSTVKLAKDGWVSLTVLGSVLDLRGTDFKNLDQSNLFISAETVMQ